MTDRHETTGWRSLAFRRQPFLPAPSWRVDEAIRTGRRRVFRWLVADHFQRRRRPRWLSLSATLYHRRLDHA